MCLVLGLAAIVACNGDIAAPSSVDVPTQPPPVTVSASPVAGTQPPTTVAAPVAPTVASTAAPAPPSPSPSPVSSPSPSPSPATPAATPPPETTERPTTSPTAASPTPARATVGRIATALTVDGLQRPQDVSDVFGLGDRVYISVEFRDVREGARLGFRWSSGGCGGEYETGPQQALRRGYFAFYVDGTNCLGEHAVEITVDGAVAAQTSFTLVDQPSVAR